jgi:hypothetical protein
MPWINNPVILPENDLPVFIYHKRAILFNTKDGDEKDPLKAFINRDKYPGMEKRLLK